MICLPIFMVGLRDRAGSWNTMAISAPRSGRISSSGRPTSSVPSNRTDPDTWALGGSRPISVRDATVLPEPDSPMIASISPARSR